VRDQVLALYKEGIEIGGRRYGIEVLTRDSQSDPNRMGSLGNELVLRENVDLLLVGDGLAAAAFEICDQNGTPGVSTMVPHEPFYAARGSSPEKGYPWTFNFFFLASDVVKNYVGMWESAALHKTVGTLYEDNDFGRAFAKGMSAALAAGGFAEVKGGVFKEQVDDFSNQVTAFRDGGIHIVAGHVFPQHFATFWAQAKQAGLEVDAATIAGAFLFPSGVEALGDQGAGMSSEVWFNNQLPFTSSLTGQSANAFCATYETQTGKQWAQPMGYAHTLWEIGFNALKASGDPKNRKAVRDAIANLDFASILGRVNFRTSGMKSAARTWITMGQWFPSKDGKFPYELFVTNNLTAPEVPIQRKFKRIGDFA